MRENEFYNWNKKLYSGVIFFFSCRITVNSITRKSFTYKRK